MKLKCSMSYWSPTPCLYSSAQLLTAMPAPKTVALKPQYPKHNTPPHKPNPKFTFQIFDRAHNQFVMRVGNVKACTP